MRRAALTLAALCLATATYAEPKHGIAMYGEPALPPDFTHLPQANPDAPQGGEIVFGETGGFDSLNPYIVRGRSPWGVRAHVVESLLGRSYDEPFTLYGLLAETVETNEARTFVEFTLNPDAAFSDGSPVTLEDVIFSMETLAADGLPSFKRSWDKVVSWEQTGERSVRFNLTGEDRELPLILGLRPILKAADWEGVEFAESSLRPLIASGPYVIGDLEANRFIQFDRNPNYWGNDLPFNKGRHNLDTIRYEFFGDAAAVWQAFTAGETSVFREGDIVKWEEQYTFPRAVSGEVVQSEVPHQRPSGMRGFVFNTRKEIFQDIRVRDALLHAFNFEWINDRLNAGAYPRITSYFSNSQLAYVGAPEGRELELLQPFFDELPEDTFTAYALPQSDGDLRNRRNLRTATRLLQEAGWTVQDGVLRNADGEAFVFEIMLRSTANEAISNIYADALERLGIEVQIELIDSAQYTDRRSNYDYDVIVNRWSLSLSPGNEQTFYWGADGVETPGTRNYMGMNSPAAEAMIAEILGAESRTDFVAATRALDRVLTAGRYVIPFWHSPVSRIAHTSELTFPERLPVYGDWIGFMPDVWHVTSTE
ncbi:MAG: extracellular solute-binding protein [Pseudomonadota bacterium]